MRACPCARAARATTTPYATPRRPTPRRAAAEEARASELFAALLGRTDTKAETMWEADYREGQAKRMGKLQEEELRKRLEDRVGEAAGRARDVRGCIRMRACVHGMARPSCMGGYVPLRRHACGW